MPSRNSSSASGKTSDEPVLSWNKIMLVILVCGCLINMITAISTMSGYPYSQQGYAPEDFYNAYPGLKTCDLIYSIGLFLAAALKLLSFYLLKGFKKAGPILLAVTYFYCIALGFGYLMLATKATGVSMFSSTSVMSRVLLGILLVINIIYYYRFRQYFKK